MRLLLPFLAVVLVSAAQAADPISPAPRGVVSATPSLQLNNRHKLSPRDTLHFRILEDRDEGVELKVDESGELDVPYIGSVSVAGMTCREFAAEVKKLLEKDYYHRATVILKIVEVYRPDQKVYLIGQVLQLGAIEIPVGERFTAGKAILQAGGFTDGAVRDKVKIVRENPANPGESQKFVVDMIAVLEGGQTELDVEVKPQDLIIVPKSETLSGNSRVYVAGQVEKEGSIEIPKDESNFTLAKAILAAGGFNTFADKKNVQIVRPDPANKGRNKTFNVNMADVFEKGQLEKDVKLEPEDMIFVKKRGIVF